MHALKLLTLLLGLVPLVAQAQHTTLENLTVTEESAVPAQEFNDILNTHDSIREGMNQPDWVTAGNQPNWYTQANTPDWVTAGNQPNWLTAGNQPNWYTNGKATEQADGASGALPQPAIAIQGE